MLKGVISVMPGYAGGTTPHPTYDRVCSGTTGYVEVIRIEFDPSAITFADLLSVFFATHDPTTLNRQGNDVGTQYRSVIFTTTPIQEEQARVYIEELNASNSERKGIITEVTPLTTFWPAENYHRDYYNQNKEAPYCQAVINPKLCKAQERFAALMKKQEQL